MNQQWKMVPVEPTAEMADAGSHARWKRPLRDPDSSREIWASMLEAAPTPPASAQDDAKDESERAPVDVLEIARETGLRSYLHGVNAMEARMALQRFVDAAMGYQRKGEA